MGGDAQVVDWGMWGVIVAAIAVVVGATIPITHFYIARLRERIADPKDRQILRGELADLTGWAQAWRTRIVRFNAWLNGPVFGPARARGEEDGRASRLWTYLTAPAFLRCFQIALIYPAVLTLGAWVVADLRDFGGVDVGFPDTSGWADRL